MHILLWQKVKIYLKLTKKKKSQMHVGGFTVKFMNKLDTECGLKNWYYGISMSSS